MVLMTARPTRRSGSRNAQFQRRVPANVLKVARGHRVALALPPETLGDSPIQMTVTLANTLRFSLRTEDKALREMRHAAVVQQLESAFAAILKAQQEGPRSLSDRECHALAGIIYRAFADGLEENPTSVELWVHVQAENDFAINGPLPRWSIADSPEEQARIERVGMLNRRFGPFVDAILLREGVICDDQSRNRLLSAFARAMNEAAAKLQKNAEGDFRPDPVAARFPKWEGNKQKVPDDRSRASGFTLTQLFERWRGHPDQKTVTPSTLASYSAVFARFQAFTVKRHGTEPEATQLKSDDFRAYIDTRSDVDGVSAKTINGVDLAAINSVLNWAVELDILTENPAIRVKRKVRKGADSGGRKRKTLSDAEARAILKRALSAQVGPTRENSKLVAAKRWVPWLMAYTGTRVGEVAQLRKSDVVRFDGHWAIAISMDAGTVKTKSTWHVPLHPHLIDQGFLEFVKEAEDGHLFLTPRPDLYRSDAKASRTKDPRGILGPLQAVKNKLAAFAKAAMPDTNGPAPNHGWRHRFKAKAREYGIDREVRDAFADHASASVAGDYGKDALYAAMVAALAKIPRYDL